MTRLLWNPLLRLSLSGGAAVLLLMVARALFSAHLCARWKRLASAAALLFFLLPLRLPLPAPAAAPDMHERLPSLSVPAGAPRPAAQRRVKTDPRPALLILWLGGALLAAAYHTVNWRRFTGAVLTAAQEADTPAQTLYRALCEKQGIRRPPVLLRCGGVGTPMLMGVFRPRLLLPETLAADVQLELVIRHELTHYQGGDTLLKLAALAVRTIHWWNPLAYLPGRLLENDCELACDARLALSMTADERKRYAETILELMSWARSPLSAAFSRKNKMRGRLQAMLHVKPVSRPARMAAASLSALLLAGSVLTASALAYALPAPQMALIGGTDGPTAIFAAEKSAYTADSLNEQKDASAAGDGRETLSEALCQALCASIQVAENAFSFTIPENPLPDGGKWFIHIAGRTPGGVSLHWLEEESDRFLWQAGRTYRADIDPGPYFSNGPLDGETVDALCEFTVSIVFPDQSESSTYIVPIVREWAAARGLETPAPEPEGVAPFLSAPIKNARGTVGYQAYYGHTGLDFMGPNGQPVAAAADGTVIVAKYGANGYGNYLIIDHGNGFQTLYAHCDGLLAEVGATVTRGQQIATTGRSGNTTGPQCHFEVRYQGVPVDPAHYLEQTD